MPILTVIAEAIWFILPAYGANGLAVLAKYKKNLHPIDGGRDLRRNPILGPGKTWEGVAIGIVIAVLVALIEQSTYPFFSNIWSVAPMTVIVGLMLGLGAMAGDIAGSFIKRRFFVGRGKAVPLLDQLDFLIGALVFSSLVIAIKPEWVIFLIIFTPLLHLGTNTIAWLLRIKKHPW